jgi:hypothetical protein
MGRILNHQDTKFTKETLRVFFLPFPGSLRRSMAAAQEIAGPFNSWDPNPKEILGVLGALVVKMNAAGRKWLFGSIGGEKG